MKRIRKELSSRPNYQELMEIFNLLVKLDSAEFIGVAVLCGVSLAKQKNEITGIDEEREPWRVFLETIDKLYSLPEKRKEELLEIIKEAIQED